MAEEEAEREEPPDPETLRVRRVGIRLPFMRASVETSATLARAISLSVLGVSLDLAQKPAPTQRNIDQALSALSEASALVSELEADLQQRTHDLAEIKEQYAHFDRLTTVEREAARELLAEVEATVGRGKPKERWIALAINLVAGALIFGLGVLMQRYVLPH